MSDHAWTEIKILRDEVSALEQALTLANQRIQELEAQVIRLLGTYCFCIENGCGCDSSTIANTLTDEQRRQVNRLMGETPDEAHTPHTIVGRLKAAESRAVQAEEKLRLARRDALWEAAKLLETHGWNDASTMVNQRDQAYQYAKLLKYKANETEAAE